jgi:hypothetical protein
VRVWDGGRCRGWGRGGDRMGFVKIESILHDEGLLKLMHLQRLFFVCMARLVVIIYGVYWFGLYIESRLLPTGMQI